MSKRRFISDNSGNFAIIAAIGMVPVMIGVGVAIDMAGVQRAKSELRDAAETAAVASARSFQRTDSKRKAAARAHLDENFSFEVHGAEQIGMDIDLTPVRSTVEAKTIIPTRLLGMFGKDYLNVAVTVAAETVFEPACVLVNSPNRASSLRFQGHPTMDTVDCYIHNNSSVAGSSVAQGNPQLQEVDACLNGGYSGRRWVPAPELNCGSRNDPFSDIPPPTVPDCDENNMRISNREPVTLSPGHYCGGLRFPPGSDVTLEPGIYNISGGSLDLRANANLSGDGVMFHLTDDRSNFSMHSGGTWNVTPPTSGDYRGVTIYQDRDVMPRQPNEFTGGGELNIVGAIYAINGDMRLQGSPRVTMIGGRNVLITGTLALQGSPELVVEATENPNLLPNDRLIGRDSYIRVIK